MPRTTSPGGDSSPWCVCTDSNCSMSNSSSVQAMAIGCSNKSRVNLTCCETDNADILPLGDHRDCQSAFKAVLVPNNLTCQVVNSSCHARNNSVTCNYNLVFDNTCVKDCPCRYEEEDGVCVQTESTTEGSASTSTPNGETTGKTVIIKVSRKACEKLFFDIWEDDCATPNTFFYLLVACPSGAVVLVIILIVSICCCRRKEACCFKNDAEGPRMEPPSVSSRIGTLVIHASDYRA